VSEPDTATAEPEPGETDFEISEEQAGGKPGKTFRIKAGSGGPKVQTPVGDAPIIPLLLIGFGGYLLWFGVKYWRGTGPAVWPSYPIKSILQGKGLPQPSAAPAASVTLTAYETGLASQSGGGGTTGTPPPPGGSGTTGQIQNAAKLLLGKFGWGSGQMPPLINLWNSESGWSPEAFNPSGAYGVAQALNKAKPGECATGPRVLAGGQRVPPGQNCAYSSDYGLTPTDAQAANAGHWLPQVRWGLGYIKARYGSPAKAWAFHQANGWY